MKLTVDLRPPRGKITCTPGWTISTLEKAKALPGRARFVDKVLHFELTDDNIAYIRSAMRGADFIGSPRGATNLVSGPRRNFATRFDPTELQVEAASASRGKKLFGFFEKPGSGKTKMILDWAVRMWCDGEIDGLFVLSYAGVHEQWVLDEAPKHLHPSIPYKGLAWKAGKKLDESIFLPDPNTFRMFAMNYESYATSPKGFAAAKRFAGSGAIAAAADESQRIKSDESVISEKAVGNRDDWVARCIASGEPTPLGIEDYYSQMCFLDPGIIGCWTYEGFKSMFCRTTNDISRKVIGYVNQEHLHKLMAPYIHVGAPDIKARLLSEVSRFNLNTKNQSAYNQLKDELVLDLEGVEDGEWETYRLRGPLAKLTKLREIACGRITDHSGEVHEFGNERLDLMQTLLDMRKGKALIWSCFKADHVKQKEVLGSQGIVCNGDTPQAERREAVKAFLDPDSSVRYLMCSPAAMGTGWNLQGSAYLNLYYSNNNNAGQRWQSERRLYRLGVQQDVLNLDIIARNTVDVGTFNSNRRKRDVSDMSISEFKRLLEDKEIDDDLLLPMAEFG